MTPRNCLLAGLIAATAYSGAANAHPRDREQETAFRATRDGSFIPLRNIESKILPQMRGYSYLGPELDAAAGRYRLKFMRGQQLVWIDIDARTGQVVGRSGF